MQTTKAEAPCTGATGIRRTLQEGAFCLLQGVAYASSSKEPQLDKLMTRALGAAAG